MFVADTIENIVDMMADGEYTCLDDFNVGIDDLISESLMYSDDVFKIARHYLSDIDIIPLFIEKYMDDVFEAVYSNEVTKEIIEKLDD